MLKSLRRKKTRDNNQHNSIASSLSGRGSTGGNSQSGRNFFGDVIVISTADSNAPLAPPSASGLSPTPPSVSAFARPPKQPTSSATSIISQGEGPPSLGLDNLLPDETNFRSSLILPHLERRFSLLNTISPEAMRSHLRAQRARAQENRRPFLNEEEEEEIVTQLQARIEANAKARGEVVPPAGKGKLGILLPPINDHPWDSVIGRGTDGFGGHIPVYSSSAADEGGSRSPIAEEQTTPPMPSLNGNTGSPPGDSTSLTIGAITSNSIDSPPSPSRRDKDDRAVGSLFASRGARADAAYMRNVAKHRNTDKGASPPSQDSPSSPQDSKDANQLYIRSEAGKPPVERPLIKVDRESILSSSRSSTSSNRPQMSALANMRMSPSQPQINIVPDDAPEDVSPGSNGRRESSDAERSSFRAHLLQHQQQQRHSTLLTTLTPEAFRRVSTALDELFDHFRAEAGVSSMDDESDVQHGTVESELAIPQAADIPEESPSQRNSVSTAQDMETTAPLSIRSPSGMNFYDREQRPDEAAATELDAASESKEGQGQEADVLGEGTGLAMPGGLGAIPPSASSHRQVNNGQAEQGGTPNTPRSAFSLFPTQGQTGTRSPSVSSGSGHLAGSGAPSLSPKLDRHGRTFSIDSFGSSASSMAARYGLTPPNMPAKRTSSLPKQRKAAKEREARQSKSDMEALTEGGALSEKQKGKQKETIGEDDGADAGPQPSGVEATSLRTSLTEQPLGTLAAGLNGLASAIGSGAMAVASSTAAAFTAAPPSTQSAEQKSVDTLQQSTDSQQTQMGGRSPTPRAAGTNPGVHSRFASSGGAGAPPTPVPGPLPPIPKGSHASSFRGRPRLEHMRGTSTFSQMSSTSADSFRSAEEGESIAEGKSSEDEGSEDGRGALGAGAFDLQADPLNLEGGGLGLQPPASSQMLGLGGRAPSAAGSVGGTSGRGSFMDDDELEEEDEGGDAFQYDRRATLRPAPRSPDVRPASDTYNELRSSLAPDATFRMPGSLSPIAPSTGTVTLQPSPELASDTTLTVPPPFGANRDLEVPSPMASVSQLGSPFPDVPSTLPGASDSDGFQPPAATSPGTSPTTSMDRTSRMSGQVGRPPQTAPPMSSASNASHRRGTSTSSVSSFSGEASLIGAQNIGNRRRSSTLSSRIIPPTSAATHSPAAPASVRSSVASGTGSAQGTPSASGHIRGRSGSVDGLRSLDSAQRTMQSPHASVVSARPLADGSSGEPMNLAGPPNSYGQHAVQGRTMGRPGHMATGSGSSYGHQRFGSAAGTQLSFDPANGRIRVGPNVPNAYTFAPVSPTTAGPPAMMTHSASGTMSIPVIDSPQTAPPVPPKQGRQGYTPAQPSPSQTQGGAPPSAPFEGPVPMMQMSPQSGSATQPAQNSAGQASLANMHRRRLSNKGSNGSLNRNMANATLTGMGNAMRPSSTTSSNGASGVKTPTSSAGVGGLASGFSPSASGSNASTGGQRSPHMYGASTITPVTLSREPSDSSHASRWNKPVSTSPAGPPSAYQQQVGALGISKRPSDVSLSSSLAAHANAIPMSPPPMSHHSSNPSIAGSIRGTPASTTVLTAGAIAARHAYNYGPQYHRTRARSNSGSSAQPNGGSSIASPSGLGLAGFFTPSPPTTPASPGIQQQMALQAQQNMAASNGFRAAASAMQAATADSVAMPAPASAAPRRAAPGPINPPGFSFPARSSTSQDGGSTDSRSLLASAAQEQETSTPPREDQLRPDALGLPASGRQADQASIRSVSDINASSDEEDTVPAAARMSVGEDVWATVARNTSMKRTQGSGKGNTPGGRAASVKSPEPQMMRKRSRDLLSAPMGEASIPLNTDSSVLTAEQLAEIQSALSRSESQRSVSRTGAPSRLGAYPPPVPAIPDAVQREMASANQNTMVQGPGHDGSTLGLNLDSSRQEGGSQFTQGAYVSQGQQQAQIPTASNGTPSSAGGHTRAPSNTHIAANTPVLASAFKSEVMYDVTTSHRPTSPTFSHRSKRSDLPSILDLSTQGSGMRPISPVQDLDEHALSLSQAIDEANARQVEFTFPAMNDRGHRRGNSSIDSRFSGRAPMPLPSQQQAAVVHQEAIMEESSEYEGGHHRVSSSSRAGPRRSKSHDQLTNMPSQTIDIPVTPASEAHMTMGPRLVDDVAAQTRAATRALKGPEENAALAVPKRSRTLSKRKSQKKINKIISQPQLLGTTQRLDHALDIKTPDAGLKRSPTQPGNSPGEKNYSTLGHSSRVDPNGKTLHRRHSSSFGNSGDFKNQWGQTTATPDTSMGGAGSGLHFPMPSPVTPTSGNFGSRILGKLRTRKRTGDFSIFDKFTSSKDTSSKSTNALTKSPASSFGHSTLAPEPPRMTDPSSYSGYSNGHDSYSGHGQGDQSMSQGSPNGYNDNYGHQQLAVPRNMPQADRDARLRLVSALSFGSPLDQTIGESMGAHLVTMPEESEPVQQKTALVQVEEPKLNVAPPVPVAPAPIEQPAAVPQFRLAPSPDGQKVPPTKSARDTIVRRTIIIPTDSNFDKRKSSMSMSAKRKSRAHAPKPVEDKDFNLPPSPDPRVSTSESESKAQRNSTSAEDSKAKRSSVRKSVQDRPPTPPGAAGVGGLHRRKISADMLADQPLPRPSMGLDVPTPTRKSLNQSRGLVPTASLTSLLQTGNYDRSLAPPLPSPAATSIMSHGNGSLYDFYLNDDEDDDNDSRGTAPSPTMENSMRNHIEVTERADGSVVWQVIAGLADRSSMYSDEHRLSYLSGISRTRESGLFRGQRVESVYVPETSEKTVAGLNPDDSRSFFTPKRAGHRKSFSFDNHPLPSMPSAISSSELAAGEGEMTEEMAPEANQRVSGQSFEDTSTQQFTTPIGFDMATTTGPSTRIVYTNDADLAQLLESMALGKDSAKFDFIKEDLGNAAAQSSDAKVDQSRQLVEAEIYTLLSNQN
ncbi:hypothetical protein A4X13_0g88 [Tilletia indica]|uniref:Uncharacterized protein n=1 Tax=Tilletia indica TaxID=43049 RepID=A0A177TY33_9BASI|nr:hypothetical protein A4X13_0g88 [Tilletia indica]